MKFCPQCGTTLEQGSRFCQECGFNTAAEDTPLPEDFNPLMPENLRGIGLKVSSSEVQSNEPAPAPEAKPLCPNCGAAMEPGDVFCQECGYKTAALQSTVPEVVHALPTEVEEILPEPNPETAPAEVSGDKQFCPECGAAMQPDDVFCQKCEHKTAAFQPPVPEVVTALPTEVEEILPETIPEAEPLEVSGSKQFCPECGAAMQPDDVFCQECGHRSDGQADVIAATVIQPAIEEPVIVALPPPPPTFKPAVSAQATEQVNQVASPTSGKKKSLLIIILTILALTVVGAGGWFAYDKFVKKPAAPSVDTTTMAVQQETVPEVEPEIVENSAVSEEPVNEIPAAEPQKDMQKPAQNKQTTSNKTTPKKQATDPQKTEPPAAEPRQPNEPLTVKMKSTGAKTGRTILSIYNNNEVKSGPLFASKLKLDKAFIITKITTYHYNWGKGAQPGTILLQKKKEIYGPWQARGVAGDDGTPNAKWVCEPNERLEEGTYKVEVSDDKSWSYNGQSSQKGFVVIEGYEAD